MKKLALLCAVVIAMASCTSMRVVDSNAAVNAGAAAVQALTISDAQVAQLCSQYMEETDGQNTILPADNSYTQRLERIMSRFHNISDLNLNYKVYQSNTVNAFASGDGSIRVYSGLMDAMTDDEVFAVLGHEMGHLINKDVRDAYRAAYPSSTRLEAGFPYHDSRAMTRSPSPCAWTIRPLNSMTGL